MTLPSIAATRRPGDLQRAATVAPEFDGPEYHLLIRLVAAGDGHFNFIRGKVRVGRDRQGDRSAEAFCGVARHREVER